jgi:hypothetical protein
MNKRSVLWLSFAVGLFIPLFSNVAKAKSWHGITPLHSTRSDVRKLLGKPVIGGDGALELFEGEAGHIHVRYAVKSCEQGLPADWGNWNVAKDTVVNISITLNRVLRVRELKIKNLRKLKWYTDGSGATYYHDRSRGIEYQVEGDLVTAITYGPEARDRTLMCNKRAPRLRY